MLTQREHTRDIHCILNIVDVGCDTNAELVHISPSRRIGGRMANAWQLWHGVGGCARECGLLVLLRGNLDRAKAAAKAGEAISHGHKEHPRVFQEF